MSKIDNIKHGEPILLDGSPPCPRQKLEGKFYSEFQNFLEKKYPEYVPYLTTNELAILHEGLEFRPNETSRDRAMKSIAWSDTLDKLPNGVINAYRNRVTDQYEKERLDKLRTSREVDKKMNRYDLGAREFTFTYSPKWFDDASARLSMSSAIQKLCKYYKDEILQLRAIGEVGSAGLSHIHCFYKLKGGKKISDKNFTRAYKMWDTKKKTGPSGHQGGHHATVKSESDFQGYIDKDIENAWFEVNIDNIENNPVAVNS